MNSTAFKVGDLKFDDERSVLAHLRGLSGELSESLSTAFYSNRKYTEMLWKKNQGEAFEGYSFASPVATIDQSEAGRFLAEFKRQNLATEDFTRLLNRESSRLYAEGAKGNVYAFVFESTNRPLFTSNSGEPQSMSEFGILGLSAEQLSDPSLRDPNRERIAQWHPYKSVWFDVELPTLLANKSVNTVNGIPREALAEYWEKNNYSIQSLLRISKDISDGIFRNFDSWSGTPGSSVPSRERARSDGPDKGPTMLTVDGAASFSASRQTASSLLILEEGLESSRNLFRSFETLPGGVVFPKELTSDFQVNDIRIDSNVEGTLIVNGNLRFETGLTFEELAIIFESYGYSKPLGASSSRLSSASKAESVVGTVLRLADKVFGDFVYGGAPLGGFLSAVGTQSYSFDIGMIAKLDMEEIGRAIKQIFLDQSATVIAEYQKVNFLVANNELKIGEVRVGLHGCSFSGSPDQPTLEGGMDKFIARYPAAGERLRSLQDGKEFSANEIFRKVTEYASICALVNQLADARYKPMGSTELARFAASSRLGDALKSLSDRQVFDDSALFNQNQQEHDKCKNAFFVLLEKIKVEENPDIFVLEVGAAFSCARLSGIGYLTDSLSYEVREKIGQLRPSHNTDVKIVQLQKLCAYLAANDIFKPFKGSGSIDSLIPHNEREAIQKSLDAEDAGRYDESIKYLCDAAEFAGEGRGRELFQLMGKISGLTRRLCHRGLGVRLAAQLATAVNKTYHDLPELTASVSWEYLAALGFTVTELKVKGIPLKTLVSELQREFPKREEALMATQLVLGIVSKLDGVKTSEQTEASVGSSLSLTYRNLSSESAAAAERIVKRCVVLGPIFRENGICRIEELKPNGWKSSGLIGVDRLRIESEYLTVDSSLETQYRQVVTSLISRCQKEGKDLQNVPSIVESISSALYGRELGFRLGKSSLFSEALKDKALNCDTSVLIFADVLSGLRIDCRLIHTPGHLLLKVGDFYVETAQGLILTERTLRGKYGNFIYEGSPTIFGASVAHQSVVEGLGPPDQKLVALRNARLFTPSLGHLLANIARIESILSPKDANGKIARPRSDQVTLLKDIDGYRKADPFHPSLVYARAILEKVFPKEYATSDPILMEYAPELVQDSVYKSTKILEEEGADFEKSILSNLILFRERVADSLIHALKAESAEKVHCYEELVVTSEVMTGEDIASTQNMLRMAERARYGNGNIVFNHADLAINASKAEGMAVDSVSLYSVALWEDSRSKLGLLRRADVRTRQGDFLFRIDDYRELAKLEPGNIDYAYQLMLCSIAVGDYSGALQHLEVARRGYKPEFTQQWRDRILAAQRNPIPLTETATFALMALSAGAVDSVSGLVKFIEDRFPSHPALPELKGKLEYAASIASAEPLTDETVNDKIKASNQVIIDLGKKDPKMSGTFFREFFKNPALNAHVKAELLPLFSKNQREIGNVDVVLSVAEEMLNTGNSPQGFVNIFREIVICCCDTGNMSKAKDFLDQFERLSKSDSLVQSFKKLMKSEAEYLKALYKIRSDEIAANRELSDIEKASIMFEMAPSARLTKKFVTTQYESQPGIPQMIAQMYG